MRVLAFYENVPGRLEQRSEPTHAADRWGTYVTPLGAATCGAIVAPLSIGFVQLEALACAKCRELLGPQGPTELTAENVAEPPWKR